MSEPPYGILRKDLQVGRLVPFVGAGASLTSSKRLEKEIPSATDLARKLAELIGKSYAGTDLNRITGDDLMEMASHFQVLSDRAFLNKTLSMIFEGAGEPDALHRLLAGVSLPLLILTTNYDLLLERAFREAAKPFHVLMSKFVDGRFNRDSVLWWEPDAKSPQIKPINKLSFEILDLPIIYKLHGGFGPCGHWYECVITDDDYFETGGRVYKKSWIPNILTARLANSSFLFLGHSLRDVHVRHLVMQYSRLGKRLHYFLNRTVEPIQIHSYARLGIHLYEQSITDFVDGITDSTRQSSIP